MYMCVHVCSMNLYILNSVIGSLNIEKQGVCRTLDKELHVHWTRMCGHEFTYNVHVLRRLAMQLSTRVCECVVCEGGMQEPPKLFWGSQVIPGTKFSHPC